MTTKTKSLRAIRRESRDRRNAAAARAFNACMFRAFATDKQGRKVRITSDDDRCTREDVQNCLRFNRAVTEDEVLEQCGRNALANMLTQGYLKPVIVNGIVADYFLVTKKAADAYALPQPRAGQFAL